MALQLDAADDVLSCVSAMHDASRRLQDCLADVYEPDWFGKEELDVLAEVRNHQEHQELPVRISQP